MMFSKNNKISTKQLSHMLVFDMFSITSLIIPSVVVRGAGRDGILSIIIGILLAMIYAFLMINFCKKVEGDFVDFSNKTMGRTLTFLIVLLYIIKVFFSCVFAISLFAQIIKETLLVDTSYKVIIICFLVVASYAAVKGIEVQGRIVEVLYFIVLIPTLIILLIGIVKVDTSNVLPLFTNPIWSTITTSYFVLLTYSVLEIIIFLMPMVSEEKGLVKQVNKSVLTVGCLNIITYIVTMGMLGEYTTKEKLWSVINTMQMIQLPGRIIQRQDGFMLALWTMSTFTIIATFIFYLSKLISKVVKVNDYRYFIIPISIIIYIYSSKIIDLERTFKGYSKYMIYVGLPQSIIIPSLVILVNYIKSINQKKYKYKDKEIKTKVI